MLCHRGCGLVGTYVNHKGLQCCFKSAQSCPIVKMKIGAANSIALTGRKATPAQLAGLAKGRTGRKLSAESIEKIKQSIISTKAMQEIVPWNKGTKGLQVAWNKGMKKLESMEIISRDDPVYANFRKYRNRIAVRTKKTYEQFKEEINPLNLPLGKCGIDGAHQIDHKISVRLGFEQGMLIEEISAKENLQILPWLENIQKYDGKGLRKNN